MKSLLKRRFFLILISILCTLSYAVQGGGTLAKPAPKLQVPRAKTASEPQNPRRKQVGNQTRRRRRPTRVPKAPPVPEVVNVTLTIKTDPPQSSIVLNGTPKGATKPDGYMVLYNMTPKTYRLEVIYKGYDKDERVIELESGKDKSIEINLKAQPGILSIASTPDANISIDKVGSYVGNVINIPIQKGNYQVEISKPGYQARKETINVPPGERVERILLLEMLPPEKALAEADQRFHNKEYDTVVDIGGTVLKIQPNNSKANALVGYGHYYAARFGQSLPYLMKALEASGQIEIPINSNPKKAPGNLVKGFLILRRGNVGFKPSEPEGITFNAGTNSIDKIKMEEKSGRIYMSFAAPSGADNKWKTTELYLYPASATVTSTPKPTIECNNCQQELQTILLLIQAAQR